MENIQQQLSAEEKRNQRLDNWLNPKVQFANSDAETSYRKRATRIIKALNVEIPDRVPVFTGVLGSMPAYKYGLDYKTVSYDYETLSKTWERFNEEHAIELDSFFVPGVIFPSRVLEIIGYRLYNWPGHGVPDNARGFQYVEGEYMKADEYDAFLNDPSDFWLRKYLPRIADVFAPFEAMKPLTHIVELPMTDFASLALPDVQASLQVLIDAGKEYGRYVQATRPFAGKAMSSGYPLISSSFCKAPFDTLGDTLRGTKGVMMDMYRRPDKVLAAIDRITTLTIQTTIRAAEKAKSIMITFPLHKGADGWMNQKQFDTFYWPSLKKVINALNDEGFIVQLFAEGKFDSRFDSVNEFRKGFVTWRLDQSDMTLAKKTLGQSCCIWGNLPSSLLVTGTPEQVKERCRQLIETCAPGGGYILTAGASADETKLENLKAMVQAATEYGMY